MDIRVKDILKICNGNLMFGDEETICEDFSIDTRTINAGDVYVGIKGERLDGSTFYEEALKKGAKVCLLQKVEISDEIKEIYKDRCIVFVDDTIKALQQLASFKRNQYNIPVIAITGSVGKTSTKDIVASVIGTKYNVLKTQGNFNNHIGLPLTILKLKNHNALVVEMGMNNLGEISTLTKIARPTIAIITNIGTAHIGNLGSRENILKAKLEILYGLDENGVLIINNDNDLLYSWHKDYNGNLKIYTYGIDNPSDMVASDIKLNQSDSTFKVNIEGLNEDIYVPVGGIHFVYNALCAMVVGNILNIPIDSIKNGIRNFELSKNRMEILNSNDITIVNDCYNANFDSMKAAIESVSRMRANRKIAVLGDMLELGDFSKELHCKVGNEIAKNDIDILVTVGEEAKNIAESAGRNGMNKNNINILNNNLDAIELIKKIKKPGDLILIKASNGMKFMEIVNAIK